MTMLLVGFLLFFILGCSFGFTKVIVPSIYNEYQYPHYPSWIMHGPTLDKYNYSVFVYQKLNASAPHYLSHNRGTEAGVYLNYIVEHYDNFPDVAIFVHAHPEDHQPHWLEMVGCIAPTATYMSLNDLYLNRDTGVWGDAALWVEQCWRDVLQITEGLDKDPATFNRRHPHEKPLEISFYCCHQFILSRAMVHKRPLKVWKKLLTIIYEQDVCHIGEPDYEHNFFYYANSRQKVGPELPTIPNHDKPGKGYGQHTQGGAMEHLAHVVFGHQPMVMPRNTMKEKCQNFLPNCPHSPCQK
jgi:hypothetical protein